MFVSHFPLSLFIMNAGLKLWSFTKNVRIDIYMVFIDILRIKIVNYFLVFLFYSFDDELSDLWGPYIAYDKHK